MSLTVVWFAPFLAFNLVEGIDVAAIEAKIAKYQEENAEQIINARARKVCFIVQLLFLFYISERTPFASLFLCPITGLYQFWNVENKFLFWQCFHVGWRTSSGPQGRPGKSYKDKSCWCGELLVRFNVVCLVIELLGQRVHIICFLFFYILESWWTMFNWNL